MFDRDELSQLKKYRLVIICKNGSRNVVCKKIIESLDGEVAEIIIYKSFAKFERKYKKHLDDIAFMLSTELDTYMQNIYFTIFCERHNIKFVGNSSIVNFIATDKSLSKIVLEDNNLLTPNSILMYPNNLEYSKNRLRNMNFPVIIKENDGSDSVNLSEKNIVDNYNDALKFIKEISEKNLEKPLLIEEFIDGLDLNFTLLGDDIKLCNIFENAEIIDNSITGYKKILSYEIKHVRPELRRKELSNYSEENVKANLEKLYLYLNGLYYMRLDARLSYRDNKIYFLEFNSFPSIREESSCFLGLKNSGVTYREFLLYLLSTAL